MPQKVTQVDEGNEVISPQNPLDVGGGKIDMLSIQLDRIIDELKLISELLKGILQ